MVFSSLLFLFFFLPLVLLGHTLLPPKWRNGFLLAVSILFYGLGDARYLPLFLGMCVLNWGCGLLIGRAAGRRRKAVMAAGVCANVLCLVSFKYLKLLMPWLGHWPALPLGISFFTFQSISYLVDVYRGEVQAERSLRDYGAYILLFPQLIAGPIVRYKEVGHALHSREVLAGQLEDGMVTFLEGLAAKVLLANQMGALQQALLAVPQRGMLAQWFILIACGLQYYFDFWGYSLMAQGIGRMLGFEFPRNFHHPFAALSIRQFWRDWHITLGTWLRSYIYIPLGGSRHGRRRQLLAILITWAVSGLWHGAGWNYLLWGLYFGVLIILENRFWGQWMERHPAAGHVYTLLGFTCSWLLFNYASAADALEAVSQLFLPVIGLNVPFLLCCYALPTLLAVLLCVPALADGLNRLLRRQNWLSRAGLLVLLALCVLALIRAQYNPFLYFRF